MTTTDLVNRVEARVRQLGSMGTPAEIASVLHSQGITGKRRDGETCPVARYIQHGEDGAIIHVGPYRVSVYDRKVPGWVDLAGQFMLPVPVTNFISDFDDGRFPNLIEEQQGVGS